MKKFDLRVKANMLSAILIGMFCFTTGFTTIGHRGEVKGGNGDIVEHTFASYDHAIADKASFIELDLRQSIDGVLVVSHDESTKRLTGKDYNISDTPWSILQNLSVSPTEKLHSLDQIFARYVNNTSVSFMIETRDVYGNLQMESKLINLVAKYHLTTRVYYESFLPESLKKIKSLQPSAPVLLLTDSSYDITPAYLDKYSWVDSFGPFYGGLTRQQIDLIHEHNQKVFPWFSNPSETGNNAETVINSGIDGVFTNWTYKYILATEREPVISKLKVNTHGQGSVNLLNGSGVYLNKFLPNQSSWQTYALVKIKNQPMINVGGDQYVPVKYTQWSGNAVQISGAHNVALQDRNGRFLDRLLEPGTRWKQFGISVINNQIFYNLGGNQFVPELVTMG